MDNEDKPDRMLRAGEVADMAGVSSTTVTRWAKLGKLKAHRTLGGHRRYKESEVKATLQAMNHEFWHEQT